MSTNKITIFNTSIATLNIGDEIIVDGVRKQLEDTFNNTMFFNVPTHEKIGRHSYKLINQSDISFVAGTNLLNSRYYIHRPRAWQLSFQDLNFIKDSEIILTGVGWGAYQGNPDYFSKSFYKKALSKKYIHSVRDSYTENKLKSIGIDNVINTGCATMWDLTPDFCSTIPTQKATNVVFTLTDYGKNREFDQYFIDYLESLYNEVYYWPQGSADYDYITQLKKNKVQVINPSLTAFDELLASNKDLEYVGTRLHGGIRALQHKRRTLIIGIDNRALEKKKDFNLNVLDRENIHMLPEIINNKIQTKLHLDFDKINQWKKQFN